MSIYFQHQYYFIIQCHTVKYLSEWQILQILFQILLDK